MFVDEARVFVAGGRGGSGAVSFRREKYRPKGGPDGGTGGRGGSVLLVTDPNVGSLASLRDHPHQRAKEGKAGSGNNRTGAEAEDLILPVPVGTVVAGEDGTMLADLASPGGSFVAARGGRGGRGNTSFAGARRRAPEFAELGEPGETRWLRLELRVIADVAVVGFPNSGKSTLVAALSAARPKIADYPFTTLEPTLGVVASGDDRFTICDIPGLIEGAHEGKGLGIKFLRHAERAPVFLHLIDLATERDSLNDYAIVRRELGRFRADLQERPEVVALNKTDLVSEERIDQVGAGFQELGIQALRISALEGEGLEELQDCLLRVVAEVREQVPDAEGFELFVTESEELVVKPEHGAWRVHGSRVERWVAMTDLSNPEGVAYLQSRLEAAGVERALEVAGARHGDEVRIGSSAFEWWPSAGEDPGREPSRRGKNR